MRNLDELNEYRRKNAIVDCWGDHTGGAFSIPSKVDGKRLNVIASAGHMGWDHVSVSHPKRVPNWYEMEQIKRLFFKDDETAMQLHVPPADHVNNHANVLHLWRPVDVAIPRPPAIMVGVQEVGTLRQDPKTGVVSRVAALAAIAFGALLALPAPAEAARCPSGTIYRVSAGVCQSKAQAARQGIRVHARASTRHRIKRAPVVRTPRPSQIAAAKQEPVSFPRTPIFDQVPAPSHTFGPFGDLLPMPESEASRIARWAAQVRIGDIHD